jgi:hypothetical protein
MIQSLKVVQVAEVEVLAPMPQMVELELQGKVMMAVMGVLQPLIMAVAVEVQGQ